MTETFEQWLKAKGIDPKQLSKSHLALWRAEYDRLPKTKEGVKHGTA